MVILRALFDFLRLVRWLNLLIIALTQVAAACCLSEYEGYQHLLAPRFLLLISGTLLIAMAGYILNDYLDVKLDMLNKPAKVVIGKSISRRWAMLLHSFFNLIALAIGFYLSLKIAGIFLLSEILLWIYSSRLKKQFLSGNLAVALLSASGMLLLPVFDSHILWKPVLAYSVFAFLLTLIREIIKDAEDMKGDAQYQCRTLPIILGLKKTRQVLRFILFIMISLCCLMILHPAMPRFLPWYTAGVILLPLLFLWNGLRKADKKSDFGLLSGLCKLIMFSGILSMIFFRI